MTARRNIDLHALRILDELYKTGSLSRTAIRLELSQPAISIALAKLRRHFGDPLFTRVGHEMKPTAFAEGMRHSVDAGIAALESALDYQLDFDPATTQRRFRIAVTDYGQFVMLPRFLEAFTREAPEAAIDIQRITEATPRALQAEGLDLAVGFIPQMPEGFCEKPLFSEHFTCVVRADHPNIRNGLSLAQFEGEGHVAVVSSSSTHLVLEKQLEKQSVRRRVAVQVPNYLLLADLIASTNLVATLPRRAGHAMVSHNTQLAAYPVPFKMPAYSVTLYWHQRLSNDLGHRWLCDVFSRLFAV